MIRTATARLAERNMTLARIRDRAAPPRQPATRPRQPAARPPLPARPPVACLCGSTRFVAEFNHQRAKLTRAGQIVLGIEIVTTQNPAEDPQHADPELKARLDWLHLRKIDLADYIYVLNVGGYTGPSTQAEIAYARATGTPVRHLEPPCPDPGQWDCTACGDAWHGTPPETRTCPTGCRPAA